jgi:hypothetical protein
MLFDAHFHVFRVLGGIPERGHVLRGEETQTYVVQVRQGDAAIGPRGCAGVGLDLGDAAGGRYFGSLCHLSRSAVHAL